MRKVSFFVTIAVLALTIPLAGTVGAAASTMSLRATLNGMNEVPKHGDAHGTGTATFNLTKATLKVCYSLSVHGMMGKAIAAHIHAGKAGKPGGVVVALTPPSPKNGRSVGCAKVSSKLFTAMANHPSSYYVNVHTKEYPDGAVRGQLHT